MNRLCAVLAALVLIASTVAPAFAQSNAYTRQEAIWNQADQCAQRAARLFPDYTPQGNAARENYRRACLRAYNLPAPNGRADESK